jgi:uncharacterized repeat protein (TIGR01451 family)
MSYLHDQNGQSSSGRNPRNSPRERRAASCTIVTRGSDMKKITNFGMHARTDALTRRTSIVRKALLRFACSLLSLYGVAAYALNAPTANETFSSNFVYVGGVTRLKIALQSNNVGDITGVQLSDVYPAGMSNAPGNAVVRNTCGGTLSATANPAGFTFSGGTLHPSGCEIVVNVTGTQAGVGNPVTNTTSAITSANAPAGLPASATLSVAGVPLLQAPEVTLTSFPDAVKVGGNSTLMLSVSNPNVETISGAQFAISYPTPLHVVNAQGGALYDENLCNVGETYAYNGDSEIWVANFDVPGGSACVFFLELTGSSEGASTIHAGSILSANAIMSSDVTADVGVIPGALSPAPTLHVAFSPTSVRVGGITQMTVTLGNVDPVNDITGVRFESMYGSALANAPNALIRNTCGGLVILHPHDNVANDFHLLGGSIPAGGECDVVVNVTGTQVGTGSAIFGNIRSADATAGGFATAPLAITGGSLMAAALADESFAPSTIQLGDTSHMTITLTNPNAFAITGAQFNDYFPAGIRNAPGFNPNDVIESNTCGGTITAEPNGGYVGLSNGTIPPPPTASCALVIKVAGTSIGQWTNPTGPILAANAMTGSTAFSGLTVEGNGSSIAAPTVTKSFSIPSVLVGDPLQMTISVQNNDGATWLNGLAFTDFYPAGIKNAQTNVVAFNNCGGILTAPQGGGVAQLEGGQIPPAESCDVVLRVVGAAPGTWTNNTGLVTSDNAAPGDNASATLQVTAVGSTPDLSLTKSHAGNFSQNQKGAVYSMIAQNIGAASSSGTVTVTDNLPFGLTATAISGPGWNCVLNTLTCTRGDALPSGASYPAISVTVDVAANAASPLTNTANVAGGGDANAANNAASDLTTIDPASTIGDLTLTKFHAGNFSQGQTSAAYFLIAHNVGPLATNGAVDVVDTLPQDLVATDLSGPGWNCTLNTLTCTRSDALAAGASYPAITLTVDVGMGAQASVVNSARVSGGGETSTANDFANDPTTIDLASPGPDLSLTKNHAGNFSMGQVGAVYSLIAHNVGGASTNATVSVTDTLPASLTPTAMSGPGWTCVLANRTCSRSDPLAPGASYPAITLTATVAANAPASIINTATISGGGESNSMNDLAMDPTTIDAASAGPDLSITKSHVGNFIQGQIGGYTLSVHNIGGGATAGTVSVTDNVPSSFAVTSMSGSGWTCSINTATCTRNDALAAGSSYPDITLGVTVDAAAPPSVVNAALVSGGGETNTANDAANDPTSIGVPGPAADLTIAKNHAGNFTRGQVAATYSLIVQNAGIGATNGAVMVTDTLPQGLTATAIAGPGWTCTINPLGCVRSDALAGNMSYPAITLTVNVAGNAPASVTNTANVSGGGETNVANDAASDPTTIDAPGVGPDLALTKSHVGNFGQGETGASYSLVVHNIGTAATSGAVTVTDVLPQLPASMVATAISGPGWTCTLSPLGCTRSDVLAAGASYSPITLTVDVTANAPPAAINVATVGGGGETTTSNDVASDPTTILSSAGNHAPAGVGDAAEVGPNGSTSDIVGDGNALDSVIDNDFDSDAGDTLHVVKLSDPAHGTLALDPDGTFAYTNTSSAPTDSFTYKACDLFSCSASTTVTITIGNALANHAPFAIGDAIDVLSGGTSDVLVGDGTPPSSVLDNDIEIDGEALVATKLGDPAHGTITFQQNGTFSYHNSAADAATSDSFLYEACDTHGACALAGVTITIGNGPANHKPVVVDDATQVAPGQVTNVLIGDPNVPGSVLDNDTDPDSNSLTVVKASDLFAGSGTVTLGADGIFAYQNNAANPATTDSLLYEACDDRGACSAGLVTISVTNDPLDQLPVAADDAIEVAANGTATVLVGGASRVTANDTDPDPGETATLTAHLIGPPENGHITINPDGTFVYVNDNAAPGIDSFVYEACDGKNACDAATVTVSIVTGTPTVTCILPNQLDVVGDTVNLDLSLLFAPPAGDTVSYSVTGAPPSLSIIGSLLTGTLDTAGTFVPMLNATAVAGGGTASENVEFRVLPAGEILLRNGFDIGDPNMACQ